MDFRVQGATVDEFTQRHLYLSTSPDSGFVRTCCVMRRDASGIDMLRGCVLERIGTSNEQRTLETQAEWFAALADVFDLPLLDVDATDRNALWNRVRWAHHAWLESRKAAGA
jgi:N-hydroxyarylamine O-acetyltransferase